MHTWEPNPSDRWTRFATRPDVGVFEQQIVSENFLAARARREQVENVLAPDSQAPQARAAAILVRIGGNSANFAHRLSLQPCDRVCTTARWRSRPLAASEEKV